MFDFLFILSGIVASILPIPALLSNMFPPSKPNLPMMKMVI